MKKIFLITVLFYTFSVSQAQKKTTQLDSIIISATRIDIPFSKNSRTIQIITKQYIQNTPASNLNELLQEITGIDIRQRGIDGMQADIYIRGGNFEQTLLLIDGIKVEDPQTGHHSLNMIIPLENIERIEIIKGPASRIYGQNAFSGAINIVSKKPSKTQASVALNYGSFNHRIGSFSVSKKAKKTSHIIQYSNNSSDGYRENTDFKNNNYFLKSNFNIKIPFTVLATFSERKFGANNFYTNNPNYNEYEETQASLVGIYTTLHAKNWTFKPKIFWKRNQDIFLLKRENPNFSRNFNISNKVGTSLNTAYKSKIGTTGIGIEYAKISLLSNNLGNQNRNSVQTFIEHRFSFANNRLDITPGISFNYFSDFGTSYFSGLDLGYQINDQAKIYWNIGKSYRVPSYTELYINIPNFLQGNPNLKPEEATSQEMGFKFKNNKLRINFAIFNRIAKNLIDYVKESYSSSYYIAKNLRQINTNGFEINSSYQFALANFKHKIKFGYTFLEDDYKDIHVFSSRYLLNTTIKHHFTANWNSQFLKNIQQSITYRYIERPLNSYNLVDVKISGIYKNFKISGIYNNIFNTEYSEKTNIPMPKSNWLVGIKYTLE